MAERVVGTGSFGVVFQVSHCFENIYCMIGHVECNAAVLMTWLRCIIIQIPFPSQCWAWLLVLMHAHSLHGNILWDKTPKYPYMVGIYWISSSFKKDQNAVSNKVCNTDRYSGKFSKPRVFWCFPRIYILCVYQNTLFLHKLFMYISSNVLL